MQSFLLKNFTYSLNFKAKAGGFTNLNLSQIQGIKVEAFKYQISKT